MLYQEGKPIGRKLCHPLETTPFHSLVNSLPSTYFSVCRQIAKIHMRKWCSTVHSEFSLTNFIAIHYNLLPPLFQSGLKAVKTAFIKRCCGACYRNDPNFLPKKS
jgi:hypothetical protein